VLEFHGYIIMRPKHRGIESRPH